MMHMDVAVYYATIYLGGLETAHLTNRTVVLNTGPAISWVALVAAHLDPHGFPFDMSRVDLKFAG